MASHSNDVEMLPASEIQDQTNDVSSEQCSQEERESYTPEPSEYFSTSSCTATELSAFDLVDFIESKSDDSAFMSLFETLHDVPNVSNESAETAAESVIDSALKRVNFEDRESNQSRPTQEIRSINTIEADTSEYYKAIESNRSETTRPNILYNTSISTEIQSAEENMLVDSQEANLKYASLDSSDSRCKNGASNFSTATSRNQIASKDLKPLTIPERFSRVSASLSNGEKNSLSSGAAAKGTGHLKYIPNTQEYKNGTQFKVLNQSGSGGLVVTTPTTPSEPIFPKIEIPPILPTTMNYPNNSANPSTSSHHAATPRESYVDMSLSKLESKLVHWVNRGLDQAFNKSHQYKIRDFLKYADNELKYALDILKQMKIRINTLLTAVENLPDPAFVLPEGMRIQNNSLREVVRNCGMKVWRKLELMEGDANEDNQKFVSICFKCSSPDECDEKLLEIQALNVITNAYVKVSESFYDLNYKTEMFRARIREFCSELESFL